MQQLWTPQSCNNTSSGSHFNTSTADGLYPSHHLLSREAGEGFYSTGCQKGLELRLGWRWLRPQEFNTIPPPPPSPTDLVCSCHAMCLEVLGPHEATSSHHSFAPRPDAVVGWSGLHSRHSLAGAPSAPSCR